MPQLAPAPKFRAVGADGLALVGGKVWTYAAGTSTPQSSYTDYGLGTANTNPVILDARGECDLWLSGNYKVVLTDPVDAVIWTVDNVRDVTANQTLTGITLAGTLTVTGTAVTWSGNPTHSGNHTWTGSHVFNGSVTVGDTSADTATFNATVAAPLFSGNPTGSITSGTYTPTLVNGTNCAASTARLCHYVRVGNVVMVWGIVEIDPTVAAAAQVTLSIYLPISSNLAAYTDLAGTGAQSSFTDTGNSAATIYGDAGGNVATFQFNAGSVDAKDWTFNFAYRVL